MVDVAAHNNAPPHPSAAAVESHAALVALRSGPGIALMTATILASAVGSLDANVVKVAVPAIGRELDASVATLQWVVTSYLLVVTAFLLLGGALADHFGRRRVLIVGLFVMLLGSVLCAASPSAGTLIAARLIQGVGAALVVPTSLALLNGTLQVSDRARGIGIWAGLQTLSTTLGPYAGGWLIDNTSWRPVFLLGVPLIVGALLALWNVPESGVVRTRFSLDAAGALLAIVGLGGVIYALTDGPASGWLSLRVLFSAFIGVIALALLLPVERRVRAPMVRLTLFVSRQFDAVNVTTVFLYGALGAAGYLVILQCQLQLGYSAEQAGAAFIPQSLLFFALSPLSGALVSRVGPRWLMVFGILTLAVSFAWLAGVHPGSRYLVEILPPVLLSGLGLGLTVTPLTAAVLAAVDDADLGEASGINDAASRLGSLIVIALVPALVGANAGRTLSDALGRGFQPAMLVMAALTVLAAVVAARFVASNPCAAPPMAPPAPDYGCVVPVSRPARA